ncbi:hypothetical protein WJX81_006422 [Elliptochloris bilobata]|uniref:Uncharacterized protein n=1 Tax=Elliptochloris bilobata TaxID=381761 RepID=A0AAW1S462_9CHLO
MAQFNPNPFRGEASVPHVSETFFKVYFAASQLALAMLLIPGRVFGSEVRPRKFNRDYLISVCDEAARHREVLSGKIPRSFVFAPRATTHSWQKMWDKHIRYRRWARGRMGGGWQRLG